MSCECEIDSYPSVVWESEPVARKKHKCCECGSDISPGEKYYIYKQVCDGEFYSNKMCMICKGVFDRALAGSYSCIFFGSLWETVGVDYEI